LLGARELDVAEHHTGQFVWALGVRVGQGHGHVQVGGARIEARVEDRLVKARVARVQDRVGAQSLDQGHQGGAV